MSRTIALIAALVILELGICTSACISENSTADSMPANTESISETADAEQPAKLIEQEPIKDTAPSKASGAPASKGKSAKASVAEDEEENEQKEMADDKEARANAYMAHDDSNPGAKVDPQVYYQDGLSFMRQKKYQQALDAFSKALELNPKYYEASYRKALVYQLTGYDKYAARRYQDVIRHKPDMIEARINLAALHRKHKHYSGAEEQLQAVIQQNYYSFVGHYNLANVLVEAGRPEEALKEYKICLKLKPKNHMVHNNMGVLFLQKSYPEEALQEFRKASQLAPGNTTYTANIKTAQKLIAEKKAKGLTM